MLTEGANKYGDAAAKNVDATQRFNVALDNFKETLGTKVLPILEKGIDFLTKMLEAFDKLPTPVQNFTLGLLALVAIGGPMLTFIASVKSAAETLGILSIATGGATTATNLFSIALRAIPIIAIIATIALLIANWDDVSAAAKKLWEAITKWWGQIYDDIKDFAGKAIKWLEDNWPKILAVLTGPFGLFTLWVVTYKDDIVEKFKEVWEAVKTAVVEKVASIIAVVQLLWGKLKDFIVDYFSDKAESFLGAIKSGWNTVKEIVSAIVDTIQYYVITKFLEMFTKVVEVVTAIKTGVVEKFSELKDKAIEKFNDLKDAASKIWDKISGYIRDVATKIKEKLDTVYNDMVQVGKDIANGIIDGLFRIQGVFRTKLGQWVKDNIPDWIKRFCRYLLHQRL